jgi:hypothetical protein
MTEDTVLVPEELLITLVGYEDVVKEAVFSFQLLLAATREAQTELPDSNGFKALNNALASLGRQLSNISVEAAKTVKAIYDIQNNCTIAELPSGEN